MELLDIFGLVFIIMISLICMAVSLYLYVHFAQPLEKDFKGTWPIRILIVTGLATTFFIVFLVPVDMMSNNKL